jgi:predicted nucleic acid-binding protein
VAPPRAVLETSFWTAAYFAEVAANCFDFFELIVPAAVEDEIRRPQTGSATREYPYATLFRQLRHRMIDPPPDAPRPLRLFGPGEAEAIALAESLEARLLINEYRGSQYARRAQIATVNVPEFIVTLFVRGIISDRAARRKLEIIEPITSREFISDARLVLDMG